MDEQLAMSESAAQEALSGDPAAELTIAFGRAYHQSGMPVDELEMTMHLTAAALGIELQVNVLPTSILAAIGPGYAQRVVLLRLEPGGVDLQRLSLLNVVFRAVLERRIDSRAALAEVERIAALAHYAPAPLTIAAYCLLSVGVAILIGGHAGEIAASAIIGIAVGGLSVLGRTVTAVDRLFEVLAGFIATVVVTGYSHVMAHIAVYIPIVAGVVALLPGLQLTEALHELASRQRRRGNRSARKRGHDAALARLWLRTRYRGRRSERVAFGSDRLRARAVFAAGIRRSRDREQHRDLAERADGRLPLGSRCVHRCRNGVTEFSRRSRGYQVSTFGAALAVGVRRQDRGALRARAGNDPVDSGPADSRSGVAQLRKPSCIFCRAKRRTGAASP